MSLADFHPARERTGLGPLFNVGFKQSPVTSADAANHQPRIFPIDLAISVLAIFVIYALWRTMPPSVE